MSGELTFSQRISHSDTITVMYFVQLLIYTIGLFSCIFLTYLLIKIQVFHPNLRILLRNWAIANIIIHISQLMSSVNILTLLFNKERGALQNLLYCQVLKAVFYFAGYVGCLNLLLLVVERVVATVKAKNYETNNSSTMGRNLIIFQWITCGVLVSIQTFLEYQMGNPGNSIKILSCEPIFLWSELFLIPLIGVVINDVSALLAFIALLIINKRKYAATFEEPTHSLSERYQIVENIKATRLLYPLVFSTAGCSLLICIDCFYTTRNIEGHSATESEIGQLWIFMNIFYLILGVKTNLLPWSILYSHPLLRRETKKRFSFLWKKSKVGSSSSSLKNMDENSPKNVNGRELIINQSSERAAHFAALDHAWN